MYVHKIYLHDTLRRLVSRIVDYSRHGVPLETPVGLDEFHHFSGGEGGVEPRPQGLFPTENSRHTVVDVAKRRMGVNCNHCVCEQGLLLERGKEM